MTEQEWQQHPEREVPALPGQEPHFPGGDPGGRPQGIHPGRSEGQAALSSGDSVPVLVAWFADASSARACLRALELRGVGVTLAEEAPPGHTGPVAIHASPSVGEKDPVMTERGMGRGAVLGATVGATAGFLAATYLVPPLGAASATGAMLTTLAGAGLGSFFGNLADQARDDSGNPAGQGGDAAAAQESATLRFRLEVSARPTQVDEVMALVSAWDPEEMRLLPTGAGEARGYPAGRRGDGDGGRIPVEGGPA
ncbi:hypothetical protein [Symbiobacterium thermophilum]|uniref:Uncharacterized protein n=1 Tax=Symbiobacterium thermophilum (strain DSM 24528 / JCM 14929 / IAM 14863 / T) TaxID=292459 RepID=Q67NG2_SYMTH|nr:hypothetical protein [Symbiobacterium thermophilum]BAD40781.1 hypothetical protein STH1796 [Symbiobacterium thermophilum IAM 14863]